MLAFESLKIKIYLANYTKYYKKIISFLDKCSSSVAHLVENELPVASVNIQPPMTFENSRSSHKNTVDGQDVNEIEVISENDSSINNNDDMYYRDKPKSLNIEIDTKIEEAPQYSNVPSISPSANVPIILKSAASDHVYSNIDETVAQSLTGNRFMSDSIDLDLDDPLLSSSIFTKKNDQQNGYDTSLSATHGTDGQSSSSKIIIPSISSSSSTGTQITSIELKNVLNVVAFQKTNHNMNVKQPISIAPALRQETMIDTALDLDSLDGSQVGLMKTL